MRARPPMMLDYDAAGFFPTPATAEARAPTAIERRTFTLLAVLYAGVTLGAIPWANLAGPRVPELIAVCNGGVALADICTALLLFYEFRRTGRNAFLVLGCAYLYSAAMALAQVAAFPGALGAPLFGTSQTAAWIFLLWRLGTASLFLAAVLQADAAPAQLPTDAITRRILSACLGTLAACAVIIAASAHLEAPAVVSGRFTAYNMSISAVYLMICGIALYRIWRARAFDDVLYLWLSLVLVASISDQVLAMFAGGQYTLGWHFAKASTVVSACLILVFWLGGKSARERAIPLHLIAAYGAAVVVMMTALLLRWFMQPWVGYSYPFATVFGAVALAVWIGGWKPGTAAAVIGFVGATVLFSDPNGGLGTHGAGDVLGALSYWVSCALIIGLGHAMREARDRYRRLESEVRERAIELQRADANKSRFLAVLSHELRNPMAPLRNGLKLLDMQPNSADAGRTRAMMGRQIDHLRRLIDDLLDVSRIDRGKLELERKHIPVEAFVRHAVETAQPVIDAKSHELVVHYAPEPVFVDGDLVRLSQSVSNLLNNAAKFTPPRGRIEVTVHATEREVIVSVKDSGIGFEKGDEFRMFEMFVQLESARASSPGGLGLGLTLVRRITEMHGGTVEAHSAGWGHGSEFILRLPRAAAIDVAPPSAIEPKRSTTARRVLVVDDNADAADTLGRILTLEGFDVRVYNDAAQALSCAREFKPHVAFIDLNMPGMSGFELATRLKADVLAGAIELVALTGMGQARDLAATRRAGFHVHLTKPADTSRILELAAGLGGTATQVAD